MNFEFSISTRGWSSARRFFLAMMFALPLVFISCSRKPAHLQEDGMKALAAGNYAEAEKYFAEGIRKGGDEHLYAGFVVSNLVTGKYPKANEAYNNFCEGIHDFLAGRYGEQLFARVGITTELIPFKVDGGNDIPRDYIQTVILQANADYAGYIALRNQINSVLKK